MLLNYGCKAQPSTARSFGESATTHVGEVCKGITDSAVTELEHDLILRAADRTKTAAIVCQQIAYSIQELQKWITAERNITSPVSKLKLDASVATAFAISGESRALAFVRKTMEGYLMAWKETLHNLGFTPEHVPSEYNVADLWTKAVNGPTLARLLFLLGRESGYEKLFKQD